MLLLTATSKLQGICPFGVGFGSRRLEPCGTVVFTVAGFFSLVLGAPYDKVVLQPF